MLLPRVPVPHGGDQSLCGVVRAQAETARQGVENPPQEDRARHGSAKGARRSEHHPVMNLDSLNRKYLERGEILGAAKASDCEVSKSFCALTSRCYEP